MQSTLNNNIHLAIIMDGNRRWAAAHDLGHAEGHDTGAEALRRIVEAAPAHGITTLTVYAFASQNWRRPADETASMMALFSRYLDSETEAHGVIAMEDMIYALDRQTLLIHAAGHYHERYRIADGEWRIAETKLTRLMRQTPGQ